MTTVAVHPKSSIIGRLMLRITVRDQKHQQQQQRKHTQQLRAALTAAGPIIRSALTAEQRDQRINRDIHKKLAVLAQHQARVKEAHKGVPAAAATASSSSRPSRHDKKVVNLKKNMKPVGYLQRGPICDQHRQELMKDLSELGLTDRLERQCLLFLNHIILSNAQNTEKVFVPIANKLIKCTCRSLVSPWSYKDTGVTHKTVVRLLESAGIIDRNPHNRQRGLSAEYKLSDKLMDRLAVASRPNMDRFGPKQRAYLAKEPRRVINEILQKAKTIEDHILIYGDMSIPLKKVVDLWFTNILDESRSGYFDQYPTRITELMEDGYTLPTRKIARNSQGHALPQPKVRRTKNKKRVARNIVTSLEAMVGRPINMPAIELAMCDQQIAYDVALWIQHTKMADKLRRRLVAQHVNLNVILHSFDPQTSTYVPSYSPTRTGRVSEMHGGLQNSCRLIKAAALIGTDLYNYDMISSQVVCLHHLMEKYGVDDPWVRAYLADDGSKNIWANKLGIQVDTWKTCLYATLMCAKPTYREKHTALSRAIYDDVGGESGHPRAKLQELETSLQPLYTELDALLLAVHKKMDRNKVGIRNEMKKIIPKGPQQKNSKIMASLLQGLEAAFINELIKNHHKGTTVANEHDGLITTHKISDQAIQKANRKLGTTFKLSLKHPLSSEGQELNFTALTREIQKRRQEAKRKKHLMAKKKSIIKESARVLRTRLRDKQNQTKPNKQIKEIKINKYQRQPKATTTRNNIIHYSTPEFKPPLYHPDDQFDPVQRQLASWMPQVEYLSNGRAVFTVH